MRKNNRIYVTGASGLVGSRFIELYSSKYSLLTPSSSEVNISDYTSLEKFFEENKFSAVVNFAAFTDVSAAENERDNKEGNCFKVNVVGVENLAKLCKKYKRFLIHISTDMVFPGSKDYPGPYSEDSVPESDSERLTWYGFTKAEAERVIESILGKDAAILRIIYPVRAKFEGKLDYLRKPLKLFDEGKLYPMFNDQQVSIAFIDEVSEAINIILKKGARGVFHASSCDTSTPYELVSYLLEKARGVKGAVIPSSIYEFIKKQKEANPDNPFVEVRYPIYGGLKVEKTENELGIKFSSWKEIVDKLVSSGIGAQ
ncbi:MAG: dTDP-4-dehydrorhamnose reductase [Candidatus Woesebacteria bacterium]|jgi:dTDP-4-dehydrorhamnose reductase|nr:MAG: dTDP-4-dehydrorhamnose reductase [Candidatus Woesebacteria bacterium]